MDAIAKQNEKRQQTLHSTNSSQMLYPIKLITTS